MYKEGKAIIKYAKGAFLNEDALISRDISAAYVSAFATRDSSILDATAATGIRGIRYYLESRSKDITLLEMNKGSFASMKKNASFNKARANMIATSIQEFANGTDKKFDFIDLDPFGGVTPYIYDLMKVSKNGTRLMITATDTAVLCGADYQACLRLYDARPMHNEICQEVGLRLLIGYIARVAAQFNFGVDVDLSFSYLHYMRAFVRLRHGSKSAIETVKGMGYVYYCNKCLYRSVKRAFVSSTTNCPNCKSALDAAGRVWLGSLYSKDAVSATLEKMGDGYDPSSIEFLARIQKETDYPLYYSIPRITGKMGIGAVSPNDVISRLSKAGFKASRTHLDKDSVKTNAGIKEIKSCIQKTR